MPLMRTAAQSVDAFSGLISAARKNVHQAQRNLPPSHSQEILDCVRKQLIDIFQCIKLQKNGN